MTSKKSREWVKGAGCHLCVRKNRLAVSQAEPGGQAGVARRKILSHRTGSHFLAFIPGVQAKELLAQSRAALCCPSLAPGGNHTSLDSGNPFPEP